METTETAPNQYLNVTDNRGDAFGYSGDAAAIPSDVPAAVLDTARSSNAAFSYEIPTAAIGGNGNYEVRLYVSELFAGGQTADFRNFDATLEGIVPTAFNDIDPGGTWGADVGVLSAQIAVTDGTLNIGFTQDVKQNPIINAIEIIKLGGDIGGPNVSGDPSNALDTFAAQSDLFTGATYDASAKGSAVLKVLEGNNNIQVSNYGGDSFEVTNTGDKKISAVFIDVTSALYQDAVFDPDGKGGDNAFKSWGVDTEGGTGAYVSGGTGGYFLPGADPLANSTGTGQASNGGFKGAILKFDPNVNGGFATLETVGFSGDMDPNSIAGLDKNGSNGVDTGAIDGWDVGGISGHELIGSTFTVLFDDGSTAYGQLASDGSAAGAQALAAQGGTQANAPVLTVNGVGAGGTGTYGGTTPQVLVSGTPGDVVRITMTKGFDPVTNTNNGIDALVEDRLDAYDFKASNTFDSQTVDVVIPVGGTYDASNLFDYDDAVANNVGDGTFPGDDVAQIGFVASVVDPSNGNLPISGVTTPVYLTNEGGPVTGDPTPTGGNAEEIFAQQADLFTGANYGAGAIGSAELDIMVGSNNIEDSNYGANSFQVTNTGDKKISAIFIDVSDALYQDSVFDPDGMGGDNVAKAWAINSAGGTGAYISGGVGGYFLPGQNPLPNTTGTGGSSNGGYKGAIVKFNNANSGGFENGETVGFSGDMDPNSIAGLTKASVDGTAIDSWDVGGVSGHELIGSKFTVLFDDGTTAEGQLGSDGSASGSYAVASQALTPATTPTLTVNGAASGGTGTYGGGVQPTIIVTGDPGDTVRITMTKGFNPVTESSNGIADLVNARLARYDFEANNNFDTQTVDVVIGANGTYDATGMFDYDDAVANNKADGTFPGDDTAQIAFVANVVDNSNGGRPISEVSAPVVLTNQGGPVTGDPVVTPSGYFQMNGSGNNTYFKIQIEDENGTGGTTPGGKWIYETAADTEGRQSGFQGDGYYLFGSNTSTAIDNAVGGNELLEYTIYVPETALGDYNFSFIVSRDGTAASDQQNDLWLNFKHASQPGNGDIEGFLTETTDEAEPTSGGFVKVYGGPNNGTWGNAGTIDGLPGNFAAQIEIDEAGFYTIQVDGRSQGFHVDYFELYKGSNPGNGAANSDFITDPPVTSGNELVYSIGSSSDDWEEFGGAGSSDLEFGLNGANPQSVGMRFDGITIPDGATIQEAYFRFDANGSSSSAASFDIEIENTENAATYSNGSTPDDRSYAVDEFVWSNVESWTDGGEYRTPDISDLIEDVIGADGITNGALGFRVTGSGDRAAHSFDSSGGDAPELVIVLADDTIL